MTLYTDLDLTPDASPEDITRAYRAKAKRHHPDAGGDPAGSGIVKQRNDIKAARKRLGHSGTGPSFLGRTLDDQLAAAVAKLAEIDRLDGAIERAVALAAEYSWQVDPAPVQTVLWTTTATASF